MKQDDCTYHSAVPLKSFILDKHNGNISAFAESQGVKPFQVSRWLKRDCRMINNDIYCKVTKQVKKDD